MTLLMGQTATGRVVPVLVTESGDVAIAGGVPSGNGDPGSNTGSATAANQTLALDTLDKIYDALQFVGTDATSAQIKSAVEGLGEGASLNDLAAALTPLSKEATQQDVLMALEAQGLDIEEVRGNVALLVPDLDAVRVAVEALNSKTTVVDTGPLAREATQTSGAQRTGVLGANGTALASTANPLPVQQQGSTTVTGSVTATVSGTVQATGAAGAGLALESNGNLASVATNTARIPAQGQAAAGASLPVVLPTSQVGSGVLAQDRTVATSPTAARLSDGTAFYKALGPGDPVAADVRVGGQPAALANPVPVAPGAGVTFDVGDRPARALGAVTGPSGVALAQDRATAAGPVAARLSDGTAFYKGAAAGDNLGADLRVGAAAVTAANPVFIAPGTNAAFDVADRAGRFVGVVTGAAGAPLALNATLTDGSQIAVVRGPLQTGGTLAGTERPILFAGTTDAALVQLVNVDSTGAVRLQSGGLTGGAAPTRATQVGGTDGTNLRALRLNAAGVMEPIGSVPYTAARPTIVAQCARTVKSASLPAAGTSFTISSTPGTLRRVTFRYTGSGTKYLAVFDQPGGIPSAANWTHFYFPMSAGANLSWYEWYEGMFCAQGIVLGVTATEPLTSAIVPSVSASENFYLVDYSFH